MLILTGLEVNRGEWLNLHARHFEPPKPMEHQAR